MSSIGAPPSRPCVLATNARCPAVVARGLASGPGAPTETPAGVSGRQPKETRMRQNMSGAEADLRSDLDQIVRRIRDALGCYPAVPTHDQRTAATAAALIDEML